MTISPRRFFLFALVAVALTVPACENSASTEKDSDMKPPPPTPLKGRDAPVAPK